MAAGERQEQANEQEQARERKSERAGEYTFERRGQRIKEAYIYQSRL
jgi:hypothetical protein